jgi:hypothetical protein
VNARLDDEGQSAAAALRRRWLDEMHALAELSADNWTQLKSRDGRGQFQVVKVGGPRHETPELWAS